MNIEILSNSVNKVGTVNSINNFNMKLVEPIDAENQEKYIVPLSVSYPLTSVNIRKQLSWFKVKFSFSNFIYPAVGIQDEHTLDFEIDKVTIPDGIYTIDTIVDYMNNWLEEYNVCLEKLENGKIAIHMSMEFEYWFKQKSNTLATAFNGGKINYMQQANIPSKGTMQITIELSNKLKFLLGEYSDLGPHFSNTTKSVTDTARTISSRTLVSKYMADASIGVNRMFFYCDEVQKSIVGNSKSSLLCIVPLKIKGQGNAELETFTLPYIKRKLIRSIIRNFNIQVRDNEGVLIPFDSGSINIQCQII